MLALDPLVLVEDPGHDLLVGIYVGRRNILERPDVVGNGLGVSARHELQVAPGKLQGIDNDAAFRAAEGDVHHRALERHEQGELGGMFLIHIRMEPDPALGRPACIVVLHAVAGEYPRLARCHLHRKTYGKGPPGRGQEFELFRRKAEIGIDRLQLGHADAAQVFFIAVQTVVVAVHGYLRLGFRVQGTGVQDAGYGLTPVEVRTRLSDFLNPEPWPLDPPHFPSPVFLAASDTAAATDAATVRSKMLGMM